MKFMKYLYYEAMKIEKTHLVKMDPISRPGLLTSFHLVFAGPSLGQHKFWVFNITLSGPAFQIVFVYYQGRG